MLKKFSRFSTRFIAIPSSLYSRVHTCTHKVIDKYVTLQRTCAKQRGIFFFFSPCPFILDTCPSFGTGFTDYENNSREIDLQLRSIKILLKNRSKRTFERSLQIAESNALFRETFIIYIFLSFLSKKLDEKLDKILDTCK